MMFIFLVVGAVVGYLIAKKNGNENLWLWAFLGAMISWFVGWLITIILLAYLAKKGVEAIQNMNQGQADKIAGDILQKEQQLAFAKANPMQGGVDRLTLPKEINELKEQLAIANYSYSNGKAVKNR